MLRPRSLLRLALLTSAALACAPGARAQAPERPARPERDAEPASGRQPLGTDPPLERRQGTKRTQPNPPSGSRSEQAVGGDTTSDASARGPTRLALGGVDDPKRALPDYDGRGEPKTTAGDVALWVPRLLLSPFYFVSEFLVRRPLGWLITTAERNQWPSAIRNFFTFGPEKKAGVVPTAFLDFGFRASFGIYAFWDDLFAPGNHLRLHATTLGPDWLQGAIADKIPVGKDGFLDLRVDGTHRPDFVFHGMGPRSRQEDRARFGIDRIQVHPVFETTWWKSSRLTTEAGFRYTRFRDDACCDDPSIPVELANGTFPAPPGWNRGQYAAVYQRAELTVDSRDPRPEDQSGFRVEAEIENASDAKRSRNNWLRYGGSVGGFLDIKNNRTVSLSVTTLFVAPITNGTDVPFTEQIVLGGNGPMRGYLYGRLVDRSAAIATLKYRWPIWVFLDGTIQMATGNVFGPQLGDFKPSLLRLSGALGVESVGSADHTFEFLAGFGTETFAAGAEVNSFRLLFGTNRGF